LDIKDESVEQHDQNTFGLQQHVSHLPQYEWGVELEQEVGLEQGVGLEQVAEWVVELEQEVVQLGQMEIAIESVCPPVRVDPLFVVEHSAFVACHHSN
jgi:hypothetical protein